MTHWIVPGHANVKARDHDGWTPLHLACLFGYMWKLSSSGWKRARLMCEYATEKDGNTGLHWASEHGRWLGYGRYLDHARRKANVKATHQQMVGQPCLGPANTTIIGRLASVHSWPGQSLGPTRLPSTDGGTRHSTFKRTIAS